MTSSICRAGAVLGCLEMIRGGTTCFLGMYHHEKDIVGTVVASGLRAFLAQGLLDTPERWRSSSHVAWRYRGRRDTEGLLAEVRRVNSSRARGAVGPHGPNTYTDETLLWAKDVAEREKTPLHTHIAETRREQVAFESRAGKGEMEYLERIPLAASRGCSLSLVDHERGDADERPVSESGPLRGLKHEAGFWGRLPNR